MAPLCYGQLRIALLPEPGEQRLVLKQFVPEHSLSHFYTGKQLDVLIRWT